MAITMPRPRHLRPGRMKYPPGESQCEKRVSEWFEAYAYFTPLSFLQALGITDFHALLAELTHLNQVV